MGGGNGETAEQLSLDTVVNTEHSVLTHFFHFLNKNISRDIFKWLLRFSAASKVFS